MLLNGLDWGIIAVYFAVSLAIGLAVARSAGANTTEFFAAGRAMPWWLLAVSMVATTFSTDTPNLVTDIVRKHGVAGNWLWYPMLLTGMLTVFVYARLWKRSGVLTDIEFYELRYSGKSAAFLRGFRALYLGVLFNVIVMASVSLAAIKIGGVILNLSPINTILIANLVTVVYCSFGGLLGVLVTDFFQFIIAMIGSVCAAYIALQHPAIGSLHDLFANPAVASKLPLMPQLSMSNMDQILALLVFPIVIQWWSVWYPGSEPGGGGYIAQRMLSAKSENHAVAAVFFFNAMHYALRPWPWIIVALCSMVVFPDIDSLKAAFPQAARVANDDMGYPAMLTFLPAGLMGLVVASLIAAYMSTISTHLNWGSSYVVNDFYKRFIKPDSSERELVRVGRISTVALMILASLLALVMQSAIQNFQIILQIGAGTGLLFILRWFWWRINAASEVTAMTVSFLVALFFRFLYPALGLPELTEWQQMTVGVAITTPCWIAVTFLTQPVDRDTLIRFYRLTKPGGPGWRPVVEAARAASPSNDDLDLAWQVPQGIVCMIYGCISIYGALIATGEWIYGHVPQASFLTAVTVVAALLLMRAWKRMSVVPGA